MAPITNFYPTTNFGKGLLTFISASIEIVPTMSDYDELLLFKGEWIKPSSCFLSAPDYVRSKRVLRPMSARTDANSLEPLQIRHFYHLVLCIPNFPRTWAAIIDELRGIQRCTGQTSIQQVTELYRALNELQVSEPERVTIRLVCRDIHTLVC